MSLIIIKLHRPRSTPSALGPAPLITYPHHPSQAGGTLETVLYSPPPSWGGPVRVAAAYLGGKDRQGERKGDGRMRRDRDERKEKKKLSARFPDTLPLGPQPAEMLSLAVPCDGTGHPLVDGSPLLHLLADGDGSSGLMAAGSVSPVPCSSPTWRTAAGSGLLANGANSSTPSRTAATPPRPWSMVASFPFHLLHNRSSTTTSGNHRQSPLLLAA